MSLKYRILSFLFYLGFPLFPSQKFGEKYKNTNVGEHYKNATIALFVMNSCMLIALLIWIFGITIYAKYSPSSLETLILFDRFYLIYIVAAIFAFGIIVWLIYVFGFLFKKEVKLRLFSKLKKNQKILSLSHYFQTIYIIVLLMIVFISVHSHKLSQNVIKPAKVKSYNRISTYPEHIFWLWIELPKILKNDVE